MLGASTNLDSFLEVKNAIHRNHEDTENIINAFKKHLYHSLLEDKGFHR